MLLYGSFHKESFFVSLCAFSHFFTLFLFDFSFVKHIYLKHLVNALPFISSFAEDVLSKQNNTPEVLLTEPS